MDNKRIQFAGRTHPEAAIVPGRHHPPGFDKDVRGPRYGRRSPRLLSSHLYFLSPAHHTVTNLSHARAGDRVPCGKDRFSDIRQLRLSRTRDAQGQGDTARDAPARERLLGMIDP